MTDRRPRSPGLVFSALAIVIIVLLGVFALTANQPPPPTIAEFAPQAVENITNAPTDQSSSSGRSGGAGSGALEETPTPPPLSAPVIDVPRVRRCIGDPPRQTEDPQSPPCVAYFAGDNGGATSKGVTRDEIVIAMAGTNGNTTIPTGLFEALTAFFNKRFEFYGRRIALKVYTPGDGSPAQQNSDAVKVDEQFKAFGAVEYGMDLARGGQQSYFDALTQRGIVSTGFTTNFSPFGHYREKAPFQWVYFPDIGATQKAAANFFCNSLNGRPAAHAGLGTVGKDRKFGLLSEQAGNGGIEYADVSIFEAAIKECGAPYGGHVEVSDFDSAASRNAVLQLRNEGVTSILCLCNPFNIGDIHMVQAQNQGFEPEWLLADYHNMPNDSATEGFWPKTQAIHAFGITFANKLVERSAMPFDLALKEAAPGFDGDYSISHQFYEAFLIMASGIQMAGPTLTPKSFREGLMKASFPNPSVGAPPLYQARVDYADGNPWMQRNASLIWYSATDPSPVTERPGTFCYAKAGVRYDASGFPPDEAGLFSQPCR